MVAVRAPRICPARSRTCLGQSGYNKRLRAALPLIKRLIRVLAADTDLWADPMWMVDSTPVECARSRPTVQAVEPGRLGRLRLLRLPLPVLLGPAAAPGLHPGRAAGHLGAGRPETRRTPGPHRRPRTRPDPDRRPARAGDHRRQGLRLRRARPLPRRPRRARCCARPTATARPRPGEHLLKPIRQLIESVNDTLKGQLDLELHGGRSIDGVGARVAPTPPRPHRRHLAQPRHRPTRHPIPDRLRPLIKFGLTRLGRVSQSAVDADGVQASSGNAEEESDTSFRRGQRGDPGRHVASASSAWGVTYP